MKKFVSLSLLTLFGSSVMAQDVALYADPPPSDAAFVRFIGFESEVISWQGLDFSQPVDMVSPYFVVHASHIGHEIGDFVTVLPDLNIVEPAKDVAKVTIGLVNLSDIPVSLKTADGAVEIITLTPPGEAGWREVNPISVSLQAFVDETAVGTSVDLQLARAQHRTLVLTPDNLILDIPTMYVEGVVE